MEKAVEFRENRGGWTDLETEKVREVANNYKAVKVTGRVDGVNKTVIVYFSPALLEELKRSKFEYEILD